ncbi:ATP-dependent zinc protease family protein [Wohlfahrtiimonas larvae]|uniref:Retropepsin-like aspartic endopeptidase domain-containing protein n=1 Tax=Wohlfahrtiimonas larvae TaxID=1157986 RepID=A0ABP9MLG9_9GAMM|nr:RimK/LysX family protein [Wohlfahrtiimonas larvae]
MSNMKKMILLSLVTFSTLAVSYADKQEEQVESGAQAIADEKIEAKPEITKVIYGHDEIVILPQLGNMSLPAKLDTGAKTASLNALDLKIFTKNKEKWVRFQVESGKKYYEFPIKRMSRIKKRSGEIESPDASTSAERPVIELEVCMGDQRKKLEVNLTDRTHFTFPLLIGKIGLTKLKAIVDPSVSKLSKPICPTTK